MWPPIAAVYESGSDPTETFDRFMGYPLLRLSEDHRGFYLVPDLLIFSGSPFR